MTRPQLAPAAGKQCACTTIGRVRPKIIYCLLHADAPRMAKALTAWQNAFAGIANPAAVPELVKVARAIHLFAKENPWTGLVDSGNYGENLDKALSAALAALDKKGERPMSTASRFIGVETPTEFWVECCVCSGSELVVDAENREEALKIMRAKGWRFSKQNGGRCPECVKGRFFP